MLNLDTTLTPRVFPSVACDPLEWRSRSSISRSRINPTHTSECRHESVLLEPWDRVLSTPFWKTVTGRVLLVAWSVAGATLFGFATGAVLGTVAGGWVSPLARDSSLLTEQVLLMAFVGALFGAVMGGRRSDPLAASDPPAGQFAL